MKVFEGSIISVEQMEVELPNRARLRMEIVRHPGGAAVVAVDAAGSICLLKQYRHAIGAWLWELPAGKIDHGEPPLDTAQRELAEEAGVRAARWDSLGAIVTSPGVFTEVVHLWLARGLAPVAPGPNEHEVFEVHWIPLEEALQRALSGDVTDAKTVAGLARAMDALRRHG